MENVKRADSWRTRKTMLLFSLLYYDIDKKIIIKERNYIYIIINFNNDEDSVVDVDDEDEMILYLLLLLLLSYIYML